AGARRTRSPVSVTGGAHPHLQRTTAQEGLHPRLPLLRQDHRGNQGPSPPGRLGACPGAQLPHSHRPQTRPPRELRPPAKDRIRTHCSLDMFFFSHFFRVLSSFSWLISSLFNRRSCILSVPLLDDSLHRRHPLLEPMLV